MKQVLEKAVRPEINPVCFSGKFMVIFQNSVWKKPFSSLLLTFKEIK
jgi:hypothetical protein